MELDILEKNVLKAIEISSIYQITHIKIVYEKCKSFDKTIKVLKLASERHIPLSDASDWLGYNQP